MTALTAYASLFLGAFLAATVIPGSSEALLAAFVVGGEGDPWLLLIVATVGNVLGSVANWYCGRFLAAFRDRRWFPISPRRYEQAIRWFRRYGLWSLPFAWLPFVGDPLTVAAGVLRVPLLPFVLLVGIGKLARYLAVLAVTLHWWA